jgi:excisionase family DNA binding protein
MHAKWDLGLGNLLEAGREGALLAKAASAAKGELEKELTAARKAVQSNSYCWTTKDVAREFGVHPKTVDRWRRELGLPFKKFGRTVRFRPGDVRRWDAQRRRR